MNIRHRKAWLHNLVLFIEQHFNQKEGEKQYVTAFKFATTGLYNNKSEGFILSYLTCSQLLV